MCYKKHIFYARMVCNLSLLVGPFQVAGLDVQRTTIATLYSVLRTVLTAASILSPRVSVDYCFSLLAINYSTLLRTAVMSNEYD